MIVVKNSSRPPDEKAGSIHHVRMAVENGLDDRIDFRWIVFRVRILNDNDGTAADLKSPPQCRSFAGIFLMDNPHSRVGRGPRIRDGAAAVGGTIINDDQLQMMWNILQHPSNH